MKFNTVSKVWARSASVPILVLSVVLGGCKELTGTQSLSAGVDNPSYYNTPAGALGMRNAADSLFEAALLIYIGEAGQLSDEMAQAPFLGTANGIPLAVTSSLDQRILLNAAGQAGTDSYAALQQVRGATNQAIGALAAYDSAASPALRGEMYALQGYAEIMLADLFCSGVPLSTLDFNANFTYKAGSTTAQVYQDAIAKFTTALAISADSNRIMNLARVGLGRAQLELGNYAEAAKAVESVPDGYVDQVMVQWRGNDVGVILNALTSEGSGEFTMSDDEGVNGLPFISSGDPRTTSVLIEDSNGDLVSFPAKYNAALTSPFYSPITLADWIEARLIRAEAALAVHDTASWLSQLNDLRQNATVPGQTGPLSPLREPASDSARLSLLFQERAYWLFITGHRQGDLRRLIRQYGRPQNTVYPTGAYLPSGQGTYGTDVTVPIPSAESDNNPLSHGCIDRNA